MRISVPYLFLCCLCMSLTLKLQAQDPIFSQFFANNQYLNPAFTAFSGGSSVHMHSRMQWMGVQQGISRFNTQSLSADTYVPEYGLGLGLFFNHNTEGEAQIDWTNVGLSVSWRLTDYTRASFKNFDLMLGVATSYNQRTLNGWNNLFFSENLDEIRGIISTQNQRNFPITKYQDVKLGGAIDIFGLELGGTWKHPSQPADCPSCRLPRGRTFHALYVYQWRSSMLSGATSDQQLVPFFRSERQRMGLLQDNEATTDWFYYSREAGIEWAIASHGYKNSRRGPQVAPFAGISYRWQGVPPKRRNIQEIEGITMSALIMNVGCETYVGDVLTRIGISYDVNMFSSVSSNSNLGALEFYLNMTFPKVYVFESINTKVISLNRKRCPASGRGGRKYNLYRKGR